MTREHFLQKTLTPNDIGRTGSHQAGIHVPLGIADYFPTLLEEVLNPSTWITVVGEGGQRWRWRWIYYNNALHGHGTRNEYRLTHTASFLKGSGANSGQVLELERLENGEFAARVRGQPRSGVLVLSTNGNWRTVRLSR